MTTQIHDRLPLHDAPAPQQYLIRAETYTLFRKGREAGYRILRQPGFPPPCGDVYSVTMLAEWDLGRRNWHTVDELLVTTPPAPRARNPKPATQLPPKKSPGRRNAA